VLGGCGAREENGLATLDNPPFAMRPQRMGHPADVAMLGTCGTSEEDGLALLDNPPFAVKLQRMGHPAIGMGHPVVGVGQSVVAKMVCWRSLGMVRSCCRRRRW